VEFAAVFTEELAYTFLVSSHTLIEHLLQALRESVKVSSLMKPKSYLMEAGEGHDNKKL
jgi:hypothetical protein